MLKNHHFQQSLRTSASQVSLSIYDEEVTREPPQMIRQNKFTKTYAKLTYIPLTIHVPTLIPRNIQHLYISHNNISSLEGIQNYPNLVSLNLSYNRLTMIEQLKIIQNPDYLLRIGLKMNDFVYGYQDYAIKLLRNLLKIDDICVKDKIKVKEIWETGERIASHFLQFYIRLQRVLDFMKDLIGKSKLHNQMGLSQGNSKYPNPQLKLLFEHMTQNFVSKISSNYILPSEEQFIHLTPLQILKKTQTIISIALQERIDFKCTCRPKLPYDEEIKIAFSEICNKFLFHFQNRYNKDLRNGMRKVEGKLCSLYQNRKWQQWQLYGMVQNYLELGVGGKRLSHIIVEDTTKFQLLDKNQKTEKNVLKGKNTKKDDISWRNAIFSDYKQQNAEEKQNQSPNITYLLENFGQFRNHSKKIFHKPNQIQKPQPELFFDRIPIILYDKNYIEILMEITMKKIRQMLDNYDFLVQSQKENVYSYIKQLEQKQKLRQSSYDQKVQMVKKFSPFSTKRKSSIEHTERQISSENYPKGQKENKEQRMYKSTIAKNSPFNTQRFEEGAVTTTRHCLKRKDSEISFGKTNEDDEDLTQLIKGDSEKKDSRKKPKKHKQGKKNGIKLAENYSLYEINLAYKVFRGLKVRVLRRKKIKQLKRL